MDAHGCILDPQQDPKVGSCVYSITEHLEEYQRWEKPPSPTWTKLHGVALQDQLCVILLQLSEDVLLNMYKKMVMVCDMDEQLSKAHKMVSSVTECHQLSVV